MDCFPASGCPPPAEGAQRVPEQHHTCPLWPRHRRDPRVATWRVSRLQRDLAALPAQDLGTELRPFEPAESAAAAATQRRGAAGAGPAPAALQAAGAARVRPHRPHCRPQRPQPPRGGGAAVPLSPAEDDAPDLGLRRVPPGGGRPRPGQQEAGLARPRQVPGDQAWRGRGWGRVTQAGRHLQAGGVTSVHRKKAVSQSDTLGKSS